MQLEAAGIGKHYNRQWLFRNVDFRIATGESLAVCGKNGTGKSSLLQIVFGLVQASEGKVLLDEKEIEHPEIVFAISAPYLELPAAFSIAEIHDLYNGLGKLEISLEEFLEFSNFSKKVADKPVKYFSSGMQQKLKTALCLKSIAHIRLLDEPLSNMDSEGEIWYKNCINSIREDIVIVAGNNPAEYDWASRKLVLGEI